MLRSFNQNYQFLEYKKVNLAVPLSHWKLYGFILLCLLPSFGLVLYIQSLIATLVAGGILLLLTVLAINSAINAKPQTDQFDRHLTIDETGIEERRSYSRKQTSWDYFDSFETSDSFYLLGRLRQYIAIPKRSFDPQQTSELLRLCEQIKNTEASAATSKATVPLFSQLFKSANQAQQYQFVHRADDLIRGTRQPLSPVDVSEPDDTPDQNDTPKLQSGIVWLMTLLGLLFFISITLSSPPKVERWTVAQFAILIVAFVLPFLIYRLARRWLNSRRNRTWTKTVDDAELSTQIQPDGWAIGQPLSCQFFDWRDIKAFHQNNEYFGFHTLDDLLLLVPKKIFSDADEADDFIYHAIALHHEHIQKFPTNVTVVETGNPFQPPRI